MRHNKVERKEPCKSHEAGCHEPPGHGLFRMAPHIEARVFSVHVMFLVQDFSDFADSFCHMLAMCSCLRHIQHGAAECFALCACGAPVVLEHFV